ncbi:MAG: type II toxin-antitoxin system PemK/MazF family toxin [Flavobacteriales bacterium]|nr:type II toxin-antitoxin system PemK/MazF family toxin [Flavobacteriales bacterium]
MKKGEIWRATLNPVTGREQAGFRPVLIISGNLLNTHTDIVIACPLTTTKCTRAKTTPTPGCLCKTRCGP